MIRVLALDMATKLGWAVRSVDGGIAYGTQNFTPKGLEGGGMRWLRFRNWVAEIVKVSKPDVIYFEEVVGFPRKNMGRDAAIYYGFSSHLSEYCEVSNIPYKGVGVGKIKKFITGRGNASKVDVIAAIKKLGYNVSDDNQADAIALLLFVEEEVLSS